MYQPTPEEAADATGEEQAMLTSTKHYQEVLSGYAKEQSTRPQTIGYSLCESPVGLAAWIYAMFQDITDSAGDPETVLSFDAMLDDIMLYWLPNTGASSARLYWEAAQARASAPPSTGPVQVPAAFSMFPKEVVRISRRWAERRFSRVVHFHEPDKGAISRP
jgi:microsomal epoxide hydrolase